MAQQHVVSLTLGSTAQEIDAWADYQVSIDMLAPGEGWTFTFWHSEDLHSTWEYLLDNIKLFDTVTLTIDGGLQLNGPIEIAKTHADRGGAMFIVSGRSMAGQAIDWDADPAISLRNTTLDEVLHALFDPIVGAANVVLGVDAIAATQVQQNVRRSARALPKTHHYRNAIDRFHPKAGEKRMALAQQMCRKLGLLLWVAPHSDGGIAIIIDKPLAEGQPTYRLNRIRQGNEYVGEILAGGYELNGRNMPTTVHMMAHAARGDGAPARYLTNVGNPLTNDSRLYTIPSHEVYRVAERARTASAAGHEAERLIADANATFEVHDYTVQGHGQVIDTVMTLWAVNTIVHVRDDLTRTNKDLLITKVDFKGSRDAGQTTTLRCVPLGAIQVVPETT